MGSQDGSIGLRELANVPGNVSPEVVLLLHLLLGGAFLIQLLLFDFEDFAELFVRGAQTIVKFVGFDAVVP